MILYTGSRKTSDFGNHADSQQASMLSKAKCLFKLLTRICSRVLQRMHVSDTGL